MVDVSPCSLAHLVFVLVQAKHGVEDEEWDGYAMYDMDAGSGEEGRRRAAIAAELRPVSPTDWAAFDIDQIIADAADPVSPPPVPSVCACEIHPHPSSTACVRQHPPPPRPTPVL